MQPILSALGRAMIAGIFLMSAVGNKIPNFSGVTQAMASEGVPFPAVMLVGAIAFLIVGSVSLVLGVKAKLGATLLLVFVALATFFFHDFWTFEGEARQQQMIQFLKNVSLMGTMLFVIANGAGLGSVDSRSTSQPSG